MNILTQIYVSYKTYSWK